jgi:tetratricopeptide (TPR) repeat protein
MLPRIVCALVGGKFLDSSMRNNKVLPMSQPIEQWLKHLDAILEQHQFETAEEAEAWLRQQSDNLSIDEFFERCATPAMRLTLLWQKAEQAEDPAEAHVAFQKAIDYAEQALALDIAEAQNDPNSWSNSAVHTYLLSLFGRAATAEMLGNLNEAEPFYLAVIEVDPVDSLGCAEKLFSLCVIDGRLAEARGWLDRLVDDDSTIISYHRALLRFLEAADEAEQHYQQTGDVAAAESWHDELANALLQLALEKNPYVARLMAHPQAFQLDCPQEYEPGSAAEAIAVMYATAHLWLSDFLALSWLIRGSKDFPLDGNDHFHSWQELLVQLGGEPSDEERFAYLRQLEEMDL